MIRIPNNGDLGKSFMYIESVLNRFSRRLHKTVVFASPPSVISNFVKELPEDGIVLRCVFPCNGKIMGITTVADIPKNEQFTMKISVGNVEYTHPVSDNIIVKTSDLMVVKFIGKGSNINISALFIADSTTAQKEGIAIETLEDKDEE